MKLMGMHGGPLEKNGFKRSKYSICFKKKVVEIYIYMVSL